MQKSKSYLGTDEQEAAPKATERQKELPEISERVCIVHLRKSENPWKPHCEKEQELSEDERKTADLYRDITAILNKLTPRTFKSLVEKAMALNIDTPGRLEGVVDRIFETAIRVPLFAVAYANMCRCLFMIKVKDTEGKEVSFRKLLLNRCQKEFERETEDEQALLEKHQFESLSEEERKVKKKELDKALAKNKRRVLGNIKFIGELFKLKLVTENIMHHCVFKLLLAGDEESLESMCMLLFTIGKDLDSEKAKPRIEQYFDTIMKIIVGNKISSRMKFMLRRVVELRQNKWIPQREVRYNPRTIDDVHTVVQMELEKVRPKKTAYLPLEYDKQRKRGGQVWRNNPISNNGWIRTGKSGKHQWFNEDIRTGSSNYFGQWGRSGVLTGMNDPLQGQGSKWDRHYFSRSPESDKRQRKSDRDSALEAVRALIRPQNEKPQVTLQPRQPVETLNEEELIKKTTTLIDEYTNTQDMQNAIISFSDLYSPNLHHLFILTAVKHTYEMLPRDRRLTGRLFSELLVQNKLNNEQLTAGFNRVLEVAPDNAIHYPMLWKYLAETITPVILGDLFTLFHLKPLIFEHLNPCGKAAVFLAEMLITAKESAGEVEAVRIWIDVEITWSEVLPERQSEEDFIARRGLTFLQNVNYDELLKLLVADRFNNYRVFSYIEKIFKEEKKQAQFIRQLVTAVAETCIINKDQEHGPDCSRDKLKARKDILRKYLDSNIILELEALFTLQEMYVKYNKPAAMLSQFFNILYDEEVISEEAFITWKGNEDPKRQEGKGPALQDTSSLFEWLQSASVENES